MSLGRREPYRNLPGFPRVSGDEPAFSWSMVISMPFSPRERG